MLLWHTNKCTPYINNKATCFGVYAKNLVNVDTIKHFFQEKKSQNENFSFPLFFFIGTLNNIYSSPMNKKSTMSHYMSPWPSLDTKTEITQNQTPFESIQHKEQHTANLQKSAIEKQKCNSKGREIKKGTCKRFLSG